MIGKSYLLLTKIIIIVYKYVVAYYWAFRKLDNLLSQIELLVVTSAASY